jgi:copper homeostasis protein CutC
VAAALDTLSRLGLERVLAEGGRQPRREGTCSLAQVLGLGAVDEQEPYEALDWLVGRQRSH